MFINVKFADHDRTTPALRDMEFVQNNDDGSDMLEIREDNYDYIDGGEQAAREMYERLLDNDPNVIEYEWIS